MARPTASQLVLVSCAGLLFLFCESIPMATNDLAIFLAQGREMSAGGGLADVDAFTHTVAGTHFRNGTWGAQRLLFAIREAGGWAALQLLLALSLGATVAIGAWGVRRAARGHPGASGLGAILVAWLVVQNLGLRPQLFALPLFAAYAVLALTARTTLATGAASAAIVAVWANLHGSFAMAPVLSLLIASGIALEQSLGPDARARGSWHAAFRAVSGEARGHLLTALFAALAATANPYGLAIWSYVAENSTGPSSRGLYEWSRTTLSDPAGIRLAVALGVLAIVCGRFRRAPAVRDVPALVGFGFLALTAIRHVVWTGMVLPIAVGRIAGRGEEKDAPAPQERRVHPALAWVAAAFWIALLVYQSPWLRPNVRGLTGEAELQARLTNGTPVRLTAWATENGVRGNLFNSMEWGGWLVWRLPEARVFVDARIWIFPDDVWREYLSVSGAKPGWEETLARRNVDWALLERRFHGPYLIPAMEASARWEKRYEDETGAVFRRRALPP